MKCKTPFFVCLCSGFLIFNPVLAQTATWDGEGGDSDWTTPQNWAGDVAPIANDLLIFDGSAQLTNNNGFTAGTQFNGITFSAGAGAFLLSGNDMNLGGNVSNLSGNLQTLNMGLNLLQNTALDAYGAAITVNSVVSGGYSLTKTGTNTVSLSGANTYTGNTIVNEGVLYLTETGVASSSVQLGGIQTATTASRLKVDGVGGTAKTVNGVTAVMGRSILESARSSGGGSFTLDAGLITHQTGATFDFIVGGNTNIAVSNTNNNGILGGWAKVGSDWAAVDSGNVEAYTAYTVTSGTAENQVIDSNASSNAQINAGGSFTKTGVDVTNTTLVTNIDTTGLAVGDTVNGAFAATTGNGTMRIVGGTYITAIDSGNNTITLSEPIGRYWSGSNSGTEALGVDLTFHHATTLGASPLTDVNTLQFTDSTNHLIDLGTGTLRLGADGAIWKSSSAGGTSTMGSSIILDGGTLTAGGADNTAGEIVFTADGPNDQYSSGSASRSNKGVVINSDITDNGTGGVTAIIDSIQIVEFNGDNSYSGGTYVNRGGLNVTTGTGLGTGDVQVSGDGTNQGQVFLASDETYSNNFLISGTNSSGAIDLGDNTVLTGNITLLGDTKISGGRSGDEARLEGEIIGDYDLQLGIARSSIVVAHSNHTWTGGTTILSSGSSGSLTTRVYLGASQALGGGDLTLQLATTSNNPSVYLDLKGYDQSVNALNSVSSNGTLTKFYVQDTTGGGTLTVGNGNGDGLYQGSLVSSGLNLIKTGTGTQELSGTNTYGGSTQVNGGKLLVSGSLTGTSGVTANSGGTFEYSNASALDRDVTVNAGGAFVYNSDAAYAGSLTQAGGSISGSGNFGGLALGGSGSIDPGNSPGILAAGSFDPSGGLGANFEFTLANGDPTWSNASDSGNDVLQLTSGSAPFASALDGSNEIGIYLNLAAVSDGDVFTGGFYTDLNTDFLGDVSAADYQYFVLGDGSGSHSYNGVDYYTLAEFDGTLGIDVSTRQIASADFAGGTVTDGYISEYTAVAIPEISTLGLLAVGLGTLLLFRKKKKS